jgi:YjbE family integral membrane protein
MYLIQKEWYSRTIMVWTFVAGLLQIIVINLALSADNVIVIGMAAASLPRSLRTRAILVGGILAIILRIGLTAIVTLLIKIPLISAIGGAVLFWVAWKLLDLNVGEEDDDETKIKSKSAENFRQAIILILLADLTMSLDNVLAIAGAAHGNYLLLIIGLLISMPLLLTTGSFISRLIDRFRWIPFLGAAVIIFTGIRMILEDKFLVQYLVLPEPLTITIAAAGGILVSFIILLINRRKKAIVARKSISNLSPNDHSNK